MTNAFLITDDDIIICDPEAEYYPLVQRLQGQVIRLSPTSPHYVNPMDINLNYSEDDSPLALKSDFILSLCTGFSHNQSSPSHSFYKRFPVLLCYQFPDGFFWEWQLEGTFLDSIGYPVIISQVIQA